ncbi:DUF5681 domain-containing protein [Rhizobium sp.]|uniref:DUF5681 domain-containing protein n=1 Tax=Rhizobium sp. TaxID=391 RepID=UPI0034C5C233
MADETEKPIKRKRGENLVKHQFKKGVSGNPAGRTPQPQEVKDRAALYSLDGVERIKWLMDNSKNEMVQYKCAELLVSLQVSKAAQKIDVDVDVKHHVSDIMARAAAARQALQGTIIEATALPSPDNNDTLQ